LFNNRIPASHKGADSHKPALRQHRNEILTIGLPPMKQPGRNVAVVHITCALILPEPRYPPVRYCEQPEASKQTISGHLQSLWQRRVVVMATSRKYPIAAGHARKTFSYTLYNFLFGRYEDKMRKTATHTHTHISYVHSPLRRSSRNKWGKTT